MSMRQANHALPLKKAPEMAVLHRTSIKMEGVEFLGEFSFSFLSSFRWHQGKGKARQGQGRDDDDDDDDDIQPRFEQSFVLSSKAFSSKAFSFLVFFFFLSPFPPLLLYGDGPALVE